jgi:predicted ATPase
MLFMLFVLTGSSGADKTTLASLVTGLVGGLPVHDFTSTSSIQHHRPGHGAGPGRHTPTESADMIIDWISAQRKAHAQGTLPLAAGWSTHDEHQ